MSDTATEHVLPITVALAYAPVSYTPKWWSASSHEYDHLGHEDVPWSKMPKAVIDASPEDTLATVLDRAGDALGIAPGPDALKYAPPSVSLSGLSSMLFHIGFYRPADEDGFNVREHYGWDNRVPLAALDGKVSYRSFRKVTYRQLIVSKSLNLIEGDVVRPYICPSTPQGDIPGLTEVARLTAEAIKAAYAGADIALEQARQHADDIQLAALGLGAARWMSRKMRSNEKTEKGVAGEKSKAVGDVEPKPKPKPKAKTKPKPKGAKPSHRRKGGKS